MVLKELFGGAIVAELSQDLVDASDLRQVPDNQEVFLYPDSDVSIIVEILQRVTELTDEEAVKFHFEALAHDNDAVWSTMKKPFVIHNDRGDQTPSPLVLHGSQGICKFNAIAPDDVDIRIALFRVHSRGKSADIVVSANIPRGPEGEERAASEFSLLFNLYTPGPWIHSERLKPRSASCAVSGTWQYPVQRGYNPMDDGYRIPRILMDVLVSRRSAGAAVYEGAITEHGEMYQSCPLTTGRHTVDLECSDFSKDLVPGATILADKCLVPALGSRR